tara:strand:+ start:256 stop:609 length:354 start_codon:yes stop_codon:yes gene_type:complete
MEYLSNSEIEKFQEMDFHFLDKINKNDFNNPIKVERGRAREKQLKQMSNKERAKEKLRMRERNRLSAKSYRRKRKIYTENLKTKVKEYEKLINKQNIEIESLNLKVLQYQKIIENKL